MYVLWRNDHSLCGDVMCVCRQNRAHAAADRVAEIQAKEKSRMQVCMYSTYYTIYSGVYLVSGYIV